MFRHNPQRKRIRELTIMRFCERCALAIVKPKVRAFMEGTMVKPMYLADYLDTKRGKRW